MGCPGSPHYPSTAVVHGKANVAAVERAETLSEASWVYGTADYIMSDVTMTSYQS